MEPLAYRVRPKEFSDIIGQDHLVGSKGVIKRMIEQDKLFSLILYGKAGCGKTTIANIISKKYELYSYNFNASCDSKAKLKDIVEQAKTYQNIILVIDEIHRMNKDIQDYLLPFLEDGSITIIGLTTENPYRAINPAIRSRCHIYKMNEITENDIITLLKRVTKNENLYDLSNEIYKYIATASSCEVRTALNMLEMINLLDKNDLNLDSAKNIIGIKTISYDDKGDTFYDIASAMIKSIRGSDVDASLHYLARLIKGEDLLFITRRLMCSAYEDIALGNPNCTVRVCNACEAALKLGLPEARLPLAFAVVDLATSPKSNSTYLAINSALDDVDNLKSFTIPPHILNRELKSKKYEYKYPHDYPNDYVNQQYMPDELLNKIYYFAKENGSYEKGIKEYMNKLKKPTN